MFLKRRRKRAFTILGSCVSRDVMEYMDRDLYEISLYIARTKIVSQLSFPLCVNESEINLSSAFQKRLVIYDMNKRQFELMPENRGDYGIIDYIDERFNLLQIDDTYITKSNELVRSGWLGDKSYTEMQYRLEGSSWKAAGRALEEYL